MLNERIPVLITHREDLSRVLLHVWKETPKTKSDMARKYATEIAALCSEGLITNRYAPRQYQDRWFITAQGLEALEIADRI